MIELDPLAGTIDLKRNCGEPAPRRADPGQAVSAASRCARRCGRLADDVIDARDRGGRRAVPGGPRPPAAAAAADRAAWRRGAPLGGGRREAARRGDAGSRCASTTTVLPIQGPPGTGKTYTGARMILDLVAGREAGRRDGPVARVDREPARSRRQGERPRRACRSAIAQRADDDDVASDDRRIERVADHESEPSRRAACRDRGTSSAGRPGCGRARTWPTPSTSCSSTRPASCRWRRCAASAAPPRSLVLLGDPNQLPQVSQGVHPEGAGASALEHLVGEARTIAAGPRAPARDDVPAAPGRQRLHLRRVLRGPAGDGTRRTRASASATASRSAGRGSGSCRCRITGAGNRSREEAAWVAAAIEALRRAGAGSTAKGASAGSRSPDVLVVAPYNAQVAEIDRAVERPPRASTPTSAPSTSSRAARRRSPIYSMATSTPEDAPRDLEFLYSGNRLNVAVSRARGLAVVVASPELLRVACHTPEQMRLVNAFCRLVEVAAEQAAAPAPASPRPRPRRRGRRGRRAPARDLLLFPELGPSRPSAGRARPRADAAIVRADARAPPDRASPRSARRASATPWSRAWRSGARGTSPR